MGKLMDFIVEKMTDDKGFLQGGEGGRVFGRVKDIFGGSDEDYLTRELEDWKSGDLKFDPSGKDKTRHKSEQDARFSLLQNLFLLHHHTQMMMN